VVDDCPNGCGSCEFGADYWSYPRVGQPSTIHMYCHECDAEWPVRLQIDVTARILPSEEISQ